MSIAKLPFYKANPSTTGSSNYSLYYHFTDEKRSLVQTEMTMSEIEEYIKNISRESICFNMKGERIECP